MRTIAFTVVLVSALGFFAYSCRRLIRFLGIGRKENRFDAIGARLKNVLTVAFGQSKLLRDPVAGWMHF